jgi:hypothetical protein
LLLVHYLMLLTLDNLEQIVYYLTLQKTLFS